MDLQKDEQLQCPVQSTAVAHILIAHGQIKNILWAPIKKCHVYVVLTPFIVFSLILQVVVILPTNRKDRYDAIKKLLCVNYPGV